MTDPLDPKSLQEIAARHQLGESLASLPVEGQQRVLAKLRSQYFMSDAVFQGATFAVTDEKGRFPNVRTSDPGEIRRAIDVVSDTLTPAERANLLSQIKKKQRDFTAQAQAQAAVKQRLDYMKDVEAAYIAFLAGPLVLERPQASLQHKLAEAFAAGANVQLTIDDDGLAALEVYSPWNSTSFVIEHDWAAAFSAARDFEGGDAPLPYDCTLFEFQITGTPVLVMVKQEAALAFLRIKGFWVGGLLDASAEDPGRRLELLLREHIRAVSIALDADVATKETIRAPERLNRAREKRRQLPLKDYHIVRLNRRARATPLPDDGGQEPSHHKRMHFVRGHWRHYDNHKTWVKWHLRGDPDLGFIEKHYRL